MAAKDPNDLLVKEVLDIFDIQYQETVPYLEQYNRDAQNYDQIIDTDTWETASSVTLGQAFSTVMNLIPAIMYYTLWGADIPFELIPKDKKNWDVARKVRDNLVYTQRERMDLETQGYYTILNALKFGIGYTLVEPKTIYPADYGIKYGLSGGQKEQRNSISVGTPKQITSCRNIGVGQVYPMPDGDSVDSVSAVTVLDYMTEYDLRKAIENEEIQGNAEEIINYARKNFGNAYTMTSREMADYLHGRTLGKLSAQNSRGKRNVPVLIPILKQYRQNRHIWLACDKFVIHDQKDTYHTLHKPLAKASIAPEGGRWFTSGIVSRIGDCTNAIEAWINAQIDLLTLTIHPHMIINKQSGLEDKSREDISPYGRWYCTGDPRTSYDFIKYPQLPQEAYSLPSQLGQYVASAAGSAPNVGGSGTAGIVRGGSGALESLLQVSTGREKAMSKHIENGWYKDVTLLTLIYNQVLIDEEDTFVRKSLEKGSKDVVEAVKITVDDIRQDFQFEFNFREKLRNFLAESSVRIQVYDRVSKSEFVNPKEAVLQLIGDEALAAKLMSDVNPEQRRIEMQQLNAGANSATGQPPANPAAAGRGTGIAI